MNKTEYIETINRKNLSIQEKTDCFNFWLKNYSPEIIAHERYNAFTQQFEGREKRLCDCEIKAPQTKSGIDLLNYSILMIRKNGCTQRK